MYDIIDLNSKKVNDLRDIAKGMGVDGGDKLKKQDLIYSILDTQAVKSKSKVPTPEPAREAGGVPAPRSRGNRAKGGGSAAQAAPSVAVETAVAEPPVSAPASEGVPLIRKFENSLA